MKFRKPSWGLGTIGLAALSPLFVYLIYGLIVSQYAAYPQFADLPAPNPVGFYDYRGAINVHTTASTGSGDVPQVITAAQEADLDFLFITDLNQFSPQEEHEGYHNKLLVIVDGEYSHLDSRFLNLDATTQDHLLGLGRSQAIFADLLSQRERDPKVGLFILAHPFISKFKWTHAYPPGLDGMEVLNLRAIWENLWSSDKIELIWSLLLYPFNPRVAFLRFFKMPDQELRLWDELGRQRPTLGLAGTDAEARMRFFGRNYLPIPSYQTLFSIVSNHILLNSELTGNSVDDRRKISEALRLGRFYFSVDLISSPKGFATTIRRPSGKIVEMGSSTAFSDNMTLHIQVPQRPSHEFEVLVFKDGQRVMESTSLETKYVLPSPGVYRVVVRALIDLPLPDTQRWVPWIFSNPFYITDPSPSRPSGI